VLLKITVAETMSEINNNHEGKCRSIV